MKTSIAINPEPPMRRNDPRTAYLARTAQIHAQLGRVEQALDDLLAIFDGRPE
ncbi:MAG: hypothetical protein JNL84_08985 [Candidatus Accumulibacter sp.]|nr:hypothetical protein [Accumulibacter sp.]